MSKHANRRPLREQVLSAWTWSVLDVALVLTIPLLACASGYLFHRAWLVVVGAR